MTKKIPTKIALGIIIIIAIIIGGFFWLQSQPKFGPGSMPIQNDLEIKNKLNQKNDDAIDQKTYQDKKERTILLKVEISGGLCPGNVTCSSRISIQGDGSWTTESNTKGKISLSKIEKLENLIDSTDFAIMKERKFTGTCPTAYDGQESIYTFYTLSREERISSCETNIDNDTRLFKEINIILEDIKKTILNTDFNIIR